MIRIYWVGEDRSASERFGRELILATMREVHAEPLSVTEAGQRGLNSSAFLSAMAPLLLRALAHLDRTPLTAHSPEDRRLMLLTLAFAHVANAQDEQGPDEARHAINRRRLPITTAPADAGADATVHPPGA